MRKKAIILFALTIVMILVSCNTKGNNKYKAPKTSKQNKYNEKNISKNINIDPNINFFPIKDDNDMTNDIISNRGKSPDITLNSINNIRNQTLTDNLYSENLVEKYETKVPEDIAIDIKYNKYIMPFDYLLITSKEAKIYKSNNINSEIIKKAEYLSRLKLEGKVSSYKNKKDKENWYVVSWNEDSNIQYGVIPVDNGEARSFKFYDMIEHIRNFEDQISNNRYGYISNYKDANGKAPLLNGKDIDKYGIQAYQSAPAYYNLENKNDFRYFPDGMVVFIIDENNEFFKVRSLQYEGEYWIPKNYVSFENNIRELKKVIIVDTTNQNEALFEKSGDTWTLITYTLASTGVKEKYKYETPSGTFKVLEKKDKMYYLNDKTGDLEGYAPYATRFTAGAYVHGVPINYEDEKDYTSETKEYLYTIGTIPRTHKCVRNYTSHAKFVYDWSEVDNTAVIVID
ncbi:YkuD domain-containing protein [Gottschalkia purinilytica]|uniref:YkuD domain-containing protein n=1 Tax=Gottschalkia purinilytica TaxID=1503 RepID=A0A0L0W6X5_GOTPU|nr:L,D-transpeptidase [Gottschalkia purinilytica]KNF07222.1 YkuD domain-containing protein [Gottschalkia purinilytica]